MRSSGVTKCLAGIDVQSRRVPCSVSPVVGLMIGQRFDLVAEEFDAQAELLVAPATPR